MSERSKALWAISAASEALLSFPVSRSFFLKMAANPITGWRADGTGRPDRRTCSPCFLSSFSNRRRSCLDMFERSSRDHRRPSFAKPAIPRDMISHDMHRILCALIRRHRNDDERGTDRARTRFDRRQPHRQIGVEPRQRIARHFKMARELAPGDRLLLPLVPKRAA